MNKRRFLSNPFNVALVVVGVAFAITALAFGMMTFLSIDPQLSKLHTGQGHRLWQWIADYGDEAMYVELSMLAICTAGTIAVDMKSGE